MRKSNKRWSAPKNTLSRTLMRSALRVMPKRLPLTIRSLGRMKSKATCPKKARKSFCLRHKCVPTQKIISIQWMSITDLISINISIIITRLSLRSIKIQTLNRDGLLKANTQQKQRVLFIHSISCIHRRSSCRATLTSTFHLIKCLDTSIAPLTITTTIAWPSQPTRTSPITPTAMNLSRKAGRRLHWILKRRKERGSGSRMKITTWETRHSHRSRSRKLTSDSRRRVLIQRVIVLSHSSPTRRTLSLISSITSRLKLLHRRLPITFTIATRQDRELGLRAAAILFSRRNYPTESTKTAKMEISMSSTCGKSIVGLSLNPLRAIN